MNSLSKPWPFGLDSPRWFIPVGLLVLLIVGAVGIDREVSLAAQAWPEPILLILRQATDYGESDWILYPSGVLYVVTALAALAWRGKLVKTMLWQFASLYAFVFVGVGAPSLLSTLLKRLIGRGRPYVFDQAGLFGLKPNWLDAAYQSFPSGHATTAFALATVLGFLAPRWFKPALGLAAVIAVSRIALGMHYLSDVIFGGAIGLVGAYAVRWLFAQLRWSFQFERDGTIGERPLQTLRRVLVLRRRGSARGPKPGRP